LGIGMCYLLVKCDDVAAPGGQNMNADTPHLDEIAVIMQ